MGNLDARVTHDPEDDVIDIAFGGCLTLESVPLVRDVLGKCLAQAPEAVIVDVSRMRSDSRTHLTVFAAAARTQPSPPVPLVLYGPSPELADAARGRVLGDSGLFTCRADALAAVRAAPGRLTPHRASTVLAPTVGAPTLARGIVEEACRSWGLEQLVGPATLVTSELVSNAVRHAGTEIHLTVVLRGAYLHLRVHDGTALPPVPGGDQPDLRRTHGRGLFLVDVYATTWGFVSTDGGKIVWATLRAVPIGPPDGAAN